MADAPVNPTTLHLTTSVSGDAPERIAFSGNLDQLQRFADMVRTQPEIEHGHAPFITGRLVKNILLGALLFFALMMSFGIVPGINVTIPDSWTWQQQTTTQVETPVAAPKKAKANGPSTAQQLKTIGAQLDALQQDVDKLKTPAVAPPTEPTPAP